MPNPDLASKYVGEPTELYVFFRDGMFYPIMLYGDEDACENARINPGTLRVENLEGKVIWKATVQ